MNKSGKVFIETLRDNRRGIAKGIWSVCSANAEVIEACFRQAADDGTILLVESTSNQVDQYGGYTGMTPEVFAGFVKSIARKVGFPEGMILLGGDHLGPNAWQNLPAREAMERSGELLRAYIKAGYQKIHLDTSMFCADDAGDRSGPLADETVAKRAAALCRVAEETWAQCCGELPEPLYIIGTEVPVPGGARAEETQVHPTRPADAARTIEITKGSFVNAGLEKAWERVSGLVVQPGVEFGDDHVINYRREQAADLSRMILQSDGLVYEAHSTDYQRESDLKSMVEDHFCILKVGPWLTFAYREAVFALAWMEKEMMGAQHPGLSRLPEILEKTMTGDPRHWKKYYSGDESQQYFKRKYSFSDRSRYYWPHAEITESLKILYTNLRRHPIPGSLLSQFMPSQYYQVREGRITADPDALVHSHIRTIAGIYSRACGAGKENEN